MPKEKTHISFALSTLSSLADSTPFNSINENIEDYILGAIGPDILFYSQDTKTGRISDILHGHDGSPTNRIILYLANETDTAALALCAGYITHCVLDMTVHPLINYLAGDYYDVDEKKKEAARLKHRVLETALDMQIPQPAYRISQLKATARSNHLFRAISCLYAIDEAATMKALRRMLFLNRLFTFKPSAFAAKLLKVSKSEFGLFYGYVKNPESIIKLEQSFEYREPDSDSSAVFSFGQLLTKAEKEAVKRIKALQCYRIGSIKLEDLKAIIPGENLDTGTLPSQTNN